MSTNKEAPPLSVMGQYVKDMSFELPKSYKIFELASKTQPSLSISIDSNYEALDDIKNAYEVTLDIKIESNIDKEVAFILELSYSGVFQLNVSEEAIKPVLFIECSRLLFPFARTLISQVTAESGFPPVVLSPIDFASLYNRKIKEQEKESEKES